MGIGEKKKESNLGVHTAGHSLNVPLTAWPWVSKEQVGSENKIEKDREDKWKVLSEESVLSPG